MSINVRAAPAGQLIDAWDVGAAQHPIDRALTMAEVFTGLGRAELAALSLGERDALLVRIRRLLFGDRLEGVCVCDECHERSEFELDASTLPDATPPENGVITISTPNGPVHARLPNSLDLATIVNLADEENAAMTLAQRCLLDDVQLDTAIVSAMDSAMEEHEGVAGL